MRLWRKKTEEVEEVGNEPYFDEDDIPVFCSSCGTEIDEDNDSTITTIGAGSGDLVEDPLCDDCFNEMYPDVD